VVVVPGVAGYDLYSERFQLVAEVLSPSNTRTEIDLKLRRYREAPDNLYAVVIDPSEFLVEIHAKRTDWQPKVLKQPDDVIEMPSSACAVVSSIFIAARYSIRSAPVHNGHPHLIASGLVGEPTAPVIGIAGATNMNS